MDCSGSEADIHYPELCDITFCIELGKGVPGLSLLNWNRFECQFQRYLACVGLSCLEQPRHPLLRHCLSSLLW